MDTAKIGNSRQQDDNRIAVQDGKWLADCWRELCATFDRAGIQASDYTPAQMAHYRSLQVEPDALEAEAWIKSCIVGDKATDTLRTAILLEDLLLWYIHNAQEVPFAPCALEKANVRNGLFKSGERPAPDMQGAKLWVKMPNWREFLAKTIVPRCDEMLPPPELEFITLSEALTWIAFRVTMNSDIVHELLHGESFGGLAPEEAIQSALQELLRRAGSGAIAVRGKYQESRSHNSSALLTETIDPIKFEDYRNFSYIEDELRHGKLAIAWHKQDNGTFHYLHGSARPESFVRITVRRSDLLGAYPILPDRRHLQMTPSKGQLFRREDLTNISPWWSINQVLVWIATGIASLVENVGQKEAEHPSEHGAYIVQAVCEDQVAKSDEGQAFIAKRRSGWQDGAILAHAGRDLLGQIKAGAVCPAAQSKGSGRRMLMEEFAGIGMEKTGSDWLELTPKPLFAPAEIMSVFPPEGSRDEEQESVRTPTSGAIHECRKWLVEQFRADPQNRRSKKHFRDSALAHFSGRLSQRGFDLQVWPDLAQQSGRTGAGAKRKS